MKKSKKIKRTKGRRTKGRRTRQRTKGRKMTGGTKPVTNSNIPQKIGFAKKARKENTKNADKFERELDDYITKNNLQTYKDWKYGNLNPTYNNPDGTYNHDWFFVKENKNRAEAKGTDAETERTGW